MRVIALISAVLVSAAVAGQPAAIDLDKPGVIEQLQRDHPQRFEAVSAVLRAWQHMPCKPGELETLRVQFGIKDLECNLLIMTSYPPKRHVAFEFDGARYKATVVLQDMDDAKVQPAVSESAELRR